MGNKQSPPPATPPMAQPWRSHGAASAGEDKQRHGMRSNWCIEVFIYHIDGDDGVSATGYMGMEQALRDECLRADLELLGQRQVRILVLGATGFGKSSFINSLYCATTDQVKQYTHAAASDKSVTKFLNHPPLRVGGRVLYYRIQDAPGIMEANEDFYKDFVTIALQGHLRENAEIPPGHISKNADYYVESPGAMDRPCLVVFVLGSLPLNPSSVLKGKLDIAMELASQNKIKLAIALTRADLLSGGEQHPLINADVKYMFRSQAVLTAVRQASRDTGILQNLIFPVTNYTEQTETYTEMNIVLLYTLSKLLADAKLEAENRLEAERAAGVENPD